MSRRAAIVVNPTKTEDAQLLRRHIERVMRRHGWETPMWLPTTREDTGARLTETAVAEGVDLVVACGGDGTVMACVSGLAGTGVAMAVVPLGTGNLLVRNLSLPTVIEDAVDVAVAGEDRRLDVGRVEADGQQWRFAVMAGVGFDAAVMSDAPESLKARVGWPAYVVSGLQHLRDRPVTIGLRVDDGKRFTRRARTVVVGNVGRLQGGIELLPDARCDDGVLDVVVISPRNVAEWLRFSARVLVRQTAADSGVERFRARKVEIRMVQPQPIQLDGDHLGAVMRVVIEVEPGALLLRVPRGRR